MRSLCAIVLGCVLALGLAAPASARQREASKGDAEREEVLRLLLKSAELNPRDRVVHYYIWQLYTHWFFDRMRKLDALIDEGKERSTEAAELRRELEELEERFRTIVERLRRMGAPIDWPPMPSGPVDTPIRPRATSPDQPGC